MDRSLPQDSLIHALDDPILVFDDTGAVVDWNQAVNKATGYTDAELQSLSSTALFDADDAERLVAAFDAVDESDASIVPAELITVNGDQIPFEFKLTKLERTGTDSPAFACIGRDMTAHRATELELQAILDRMGDAFFAVDENWYITYANDDAHRILAEAMGREDTIQDLVGLHLWEEIPAAVDTVFYEKYHQALESQEPVVFEDYYEPLETWFEVRAYPSDSGLSIYFQNITDQRVQRDVLERRERVLRRLYDIIADRTTPFDEQVGAMLELGRQELALDYGTLSRIDGEDYIFEYVDAADDSIQAGDVVPVGATNCEIAASTRETVVLGDVARDAPSETDRAGYADWGISCYIGAPVYLNDDVSGTFCFYDTTPKKGQFSDWEKTLVDLMSQWVSYERQRQQAKDTLERKNEKLDQFAKVVSHDLRNPLSVAKGRLELARAQFQSEDLVAVDRALDRIDTIIGDVLALARAGEDLGQTGPVELANLVGDCWDTIESGDASLTVDVDLVVEADETQLRHVFENLFRNAVEHGGAGIRIRVGSLEESAGFYVEDDGPGIADDGVDQIFEPGYTTADDGTGLGLNIVEEIVTAHGWDIRVTDGGTGGARFEVSGVEGTTT